MTQEDKELLLKDLCARLPYGVTIQVNEWTILDTTLEIGHIERLLYDDPIKIKPYLRPMSSMTEEEKHEVMILWNEDFASKESLYHCYPRTTDFYNRHHFDYRGLIEKGLAIEVPKDNNPYEN